ncbi:unnamed protein product, partial [Effrenium voratum]
RWATAPAARPSGTRRMWWPFCRAVTPTVAASPSERTTTPDPLRAWRLARWTTAVEPPL